MCLTVSTFTKGEQMIPVLNACGIHCSVYGNHDFGKAVFINNFKDQYLIQISHQQISALTL